MMDHAIRLLNNDRLIRASHWTVFSAGAASLALAVSATLWKVFFL